VAQPALQDHVVYSEDSRLSVGIRGEYLLGPFS
jgi:hypothetical protein